MTALTQRLEHLHGGELGAAAGVGRHHAHDLHASHYLWRRGWCAAPDVPERDSTPTRTHRNRIPSMDELGGPLIVQYLYVHEQGEAFYYPTTRSDTSAQS